MNEPDYCERCNLYTMQKQDPEPDETEEVRYCPACDQFKVISKSAIVSYSPDVCKIINEDITKEKVPDWLDRDWYVNIAKKSISDFVG